MRTQAYSTHSEPSSDNSFNSTPSPTKNFLQYSADKCTRQEKASGMSMSIFESMGHIDCGIDPRLLDSISISDISTLAGKAALHAGIPRLHYLQLPESGVININFSEVDTAVNLTELLNPEKYNPKGIRQEYSADSFILKAAKVQNLFRYLSRYLSHYLSHYLFHYLVYTQGCKKIDILSCHSLVINTS